MLAHCVPHVLRTCPSQHAVGSLHLPFIGWWVGHFMEKSRKKKIFHCIYVFWAVLNFFLIAKNPLIWQHWKGLARKKFLVQELAI